MKKKLPETSLEAWNQVHPKMLSQHHGKIIAALKDLGAANYEKIAQKVSLDRHQVGRRLSELEMKQLVYKNGEKSATNSGRKAFVYRLTDAAKSVQVSFEIPKPPVKKNIPIENPLFSSIS